MTANEATARRARGRRWRARRGGQGCGPGHPRALAAGIPPSWPLLSAGRAPAGAARALCNAQREMRGSRYSSRAGSLCTPLPADANKREAWTCRAGWRGKRRGAWGSAARANRLPETSATTETSGCRDQGGSGAGLPLRPSVAGNAFRNAFSQAVGGRSCRLFAVFARISLLGSLPAAADHPSGGASRLLPLLAGLFLRAAGTPVAPMATQSLQSQQRTRQQATAQAARHDPPQRFVPVHTLRPRPLP